MALKRELPVKRGKLLHDNEHVALHIASPMENTNIELFQNVTRLCIFGHARVNKKEKKKNSKVENFWKMTIVLLNLEIILSSVI